VREAEAMQRQMPNATVKILRRKGHACLLRDDVQVSEFLREWVAV
jgi:hypothetical protein